MKTSENINYNINCNIFNFYQFIYLYGDSGKIREKRIESIKD